MIENGILDVMFRNQDQLKDLPGGLPSGTRNSNS